MGALATVGAGLWLVALTGVTVAAASFLVVPWEEMVEAGGSDAAGRSTAGLTRLGVAVGFLSLVPTAAGGWLAVLETLRPWVVTETEPTLVERAALVVPGDLVALGSLVAGLVAIFAPTWVPLAARLRAGVR